MKKTTKIILLFIFLLVLNLKFTLGIKIVLPDCSVERIATKCGKFGGISDKQTIISSNKIQGQFKVEIEYIDLQQITNKYLNIKVNKGILNIKNFTVDGIQYNIPPNEIEKIYDHNFYKIDILNLFDSEKYTYYTGSEISFDYELIDFEDPVSKGVYSYTVSGSANPKPYNYLVEIWVPLRYRVINQFGGVSKTPIQLPKKYQDRIIYYYNTNETKFNVELIYEDKFIIQKIIPLAWASVGALIGAIFSYLLMLIFPIRSIRRCILKQFRGIFKASDKDNNYESLKLDYSQSFQNKLFFLGLFITTLYLLYQKFTTTIFTVLTMVGLVLIFFVWLEYILYKKLRPEKNTAIFFISCFFITIAILWFILSIISIYLLH